jgi:uracil-DNA glycosylase
MINKTFKCDYPCTDINRNMIYPQIEMDTNLIKIIMISEAPSVDHSNYYYKDISETFFQTTQVSFQDAGIEIKDYYDLTKMGIYLTTAIKCSKKDYLVSSKTIKNCTNFLESEISQFPNLKAIMCMGDFAIKSINHIYKSKGGIAPIKTGPTYKIRKETYEQNGIRFFPSYTQTGDSFNLEKSKRIMIAEDIKNVLDYIEITNLQTIKYI